MSWIDRLRWRSQVTLTRVRYAGRGVRLAKGCIFSRSARITGSGVEFGGGARVDEGCRLVGCAPFDELRTPESGGEPAIAIGDNVHLWPHVLLDSAGGGITIGSNVSVGSYTEVYGHGGCVIGDGCQIAGHCYIIPANHKFDDVAVPIREQGHECRGIVIESDCWLGHGVSVLDGVTIGRGSVIGARAVVTKSIPSYSIAVGIPAKVVGKRGGQGDGQ